MATIKKPQKSQRVQRTQKTQISQKEVNNTGKKSSGAFSIVLAIIAILIAVFTFYKGNMATSSDGESFVVYIALTDKNIGHQNAVISTTMSKEFVKNMCREKKISYVVYDADGEYQEAAGNMHKEKFIVLDIPEIEESTLKELLKNISEVLNVKQITYKKENTQVFKFEE